MNVFLESGTLLLSAPGMQDPNFMHTAVLMCQHDGDGAYGVIVNRPGSARVNELFPAHPILRDVELAVRSGGPVGLDTMQILHRLEVAATPDGEEEAPIGVDLGDGLFLGAQLDEVADLLRRTPDPDASVRFIVGYSGWAAGQLEEEVQEGSWLPLVGAHDLVFSAESPETVWRAAIGRLGAGGSGLAHLPPDPTWN